MKEELRGILNSKLSDINSDIDSLVELNGKISKEEEALSYISSILALFNDDSEDKVMNFTKISKDDFNKVLDILPIDVKEVFASPSCNYDGLVYLIDGISNGISLTLTDEQKNSILYLVEQLSGKKTEYESNIDGFMLVKNRYAISDVDVLKDKKENYLKVIDEIDSGKYINNIELLQEAMDFSSTPSEKVVSILKYLLEYNAIVYENGVRVENDDKSEIKIEEDNTFTNDEVEPFSVEENDNIPVEDTIEIENNEEPQMESDNENIDELPEFHFNDVVKDDFTNFTPLSFPEVENDNVDDDYTPQVDNSDEVSEEENVSYEDEIEIEDNSSEDLPPEEEEETFDSDKKVSTGDLQSLLGKYAINEDNTYINELVVGDIKNYEEVLNILEEEHVIDNFKNNSHLLVETLLYSNSDAIKKVLGIIKNDLSVDSDDYAITVRIVIDTIPSVFVVQDGNYDNFINNIKVFKELELNPINLFDFSKEIFVANNDTIVNNLEIVKKYDVNITYQNAKYLLLLSNIGDRLDYYVESVYEDKVKNETFDGIEYINEYTAKLNTVTDETIKRLRYCSENSKKVFGNKPKSLVGDITNLKVASLDITTDYLNKFFNNEFAMLTGEETREYVKLIHNSSNVGNYDDELDILEKYRDGLRYNIEGIKVSYNKVLRNYSILRSYGIDTKKALHFAVCYNLVITKEEYDKLKSILDEVGGDR